MHSDWLILPLLLPTPTICMFSLDHKRNVTKRNETKRSHSSASDSIALLTRLTTPTFWFSLGHKRSYDSDSVATENQPSKGKTSRAAVYNAQVRPVFTSEGVRSQSRSCKSACDLVKIKNQNRTRSHKRDEIRSFHFFFRARLRLPSPTFRLCFSENQIVGVGSRSGRLK